MQLQSHRKYQPVVEFAPGSAAARDFRRLAHAVTHWETVPEPTGGLQFFMERLVAAAPAPQVGG